MPDAVPRAGQDSRALRRVSSLVLNSSDVFVKPGGAKGAENNPSAKKGLEWNREIVPDSEEELLRVPKHSADAVKNKIGEVEVIEISSDEDQVPQTHTARISTDPFIVNIPGAWPDDDSDAADAINIPKSKSRKSRPTPMVFEKKKISRSRSIIESSSSDESDHFAHPVQRREPEVIELSDSSPEQPNPTRRSKTTPVQTPASQTLLPPYVEEDPSNDDGSILILNDPKTARRPIRLTPGRRGGPSGSPGPSAPLGLGPSNSGPRNGILLTSDPTPVGPPSHTLPKSVCPATPTPLQSTSPSKTRQPSRKTKKGQAAAEHARREAYAQQLFAELNRIVFKDGLPKETKLNWNKRLLTTAGRAKWHCSRDGTHVTEIELAEKILDCDERIRNTLSHEMCHLACWIISGNPKENHGKIFRAWAAKIMRKRPEIEVSTTHDYQISYPFEWECEHCAKIYGRFTRSINPDECVCGACKVGKLVPLFASPRKTPRTPKTSRMASGKAQDSPCSLPRLQPLQFDNPSKDNAGPEVDSIHCLDSGSEIAILSTALGAVKI